MKEAICFPELSANTDLRPAACPRCRRPGLAWHRRQRRPVVDLKLSQVEVVQYQCQACGASVTVTPPGLAPGAKHSARTKVMSVVLWGLGLSYRDAALVMKGLGVPISHVGIIFNVRGMGAAAMARQQKAKAKLQTAVLGADETQVKLSGNGVTLGFLTDPKSGEIVGMEILTSREGEELGRWLVEAAKHFGAKALVSDELESYKPAAEKAGLEHQLCLAHWRKAVAIRLKQIKGYDQEKQLIRNALKQLDEAGLEAIRWLHAQLRKARPPRKGEKQSPEYALRMLTLDILENWNRLVCYQQTHERFRDKLGRRVPRSYQVPSTNNATENAIGRGGKIRAKRMRGFKRADTILPIMFLLASLAGVLAGVPFHTLIH
jgi:transposase-like protein